MLKLNIFSKQECPFFLRRIFCFALFFNHRFLGSIWTQFLAMKISMTFVLFIENRESLYGINFQEKLNIISRHSIFFDYNYIQSYTLVKIYNLKRNLFSWEMFINVNVYYVRYSKDNCKELLFRALYKKFLSTEVERRCEINFRETSANSRATHTGEVTSVL